MTKLSSIVVAVSLALSASFAASAQDNKVDGTLRVDSGSVMTSQGGEFATAQTGQVVFEGNRLMLPENAAATIIFDEDCEHEYTKPGVYTIERNCKRGAVVATGFDAIGAATVVAGSLGVAAILHNMDQSGGPEPVAVSR